VTAHDFEYAWKRVLDPATGSRHASLLHDIQGARAFHQSLGREPDAVGVRALDAVTLMVELEGPCGYFLHLLGYNATYPVPHQAVESRRAAWAEAENIVTNGPFILESWRRGEWLVFERTPQYHGRFRGNVARVEFTLYAVDHLRAKLEMYKAGLLDVVELQREGIEELDVAPLMFAGEHFVAPSAGTGCLAFDANRPPFDDPLVRRAFAHAVDLEAMAKTMTPGYSSAATGGLVPPVFRVTRPGARPRTIQSRPGSSWRRLDTLAVQASRDWMRLHPADPDGTA
jgi:oligopeptide transport system substrate-binding protein